MENAHDVKPRLAEVAARLSSKEVPCIFCKKLWESRLTIINDKKDILGALDALGVKYEPIPGVMDYACYKCVYRINVIIDFRRLLERNINKTRANYYYAQGNKDMCRKFLLCNDANISNTANSTSSDNLNLLITDVRSEREPERTADFLFDCFNDPDMYTQHYTQENDENTLNSSARLLEPLFETDFAEPAGVNRVANKYKNYNNLNDTKYNYKCQFCTKTYKRVHYLRKHERRHRAQRLRKDSTRSASVTPSFECDRCHDVFESKMLLKNHQKSHRNRMKCSYCTAEFYLYHDLELHEAKCYGELSAREETGSINTHYTRSRRKRRKIVAESEQNSTDTEMDTVYHVRMENVDHWVDNVDVNYNSDSATDYTRQDDDDRMSTSSRASSYVSTFSRASTAVSGTTTSCTETDRSSVISAQVHERVTYDKPKLNHKLLSTKSSVYGDSNRTRAGRHREEQLKRLDDFLDSTGGENQFSSSNWQRIRKQVKRKSKAKKKDTGDSKPIYYCQYARCYFFNESLLEMMDHDIKVHSQLPLYRCSECQLRFTRPNYLQCHLMDHPAKHHPCSKCNESFDYIHQLKYHLELHAIRSHQCPYCPRSFLKQTELDNHLRENSHVSMTPTVTAVEYKLVGDTNSTTDKERTETRPEYSTQASDAYAIHYMPQRNDLRNRQKYERVRWSLGSELTSYTGINQLTFEVGNRENGPIIRGEGDFSFDDDLPNPPAEPIEQITNGPTITEPPEDISEKITEDQIRPTSPIDLDMYQLFSIDPLGVNESEEETVIDKLDVADKITLSKKRRRLQWIQTLRFPQLPRSIFDPPLPSYSSINYQVVENGRLRILPLMSLSQPSRFPC